MSEIKGYTAEEARSLGLIGEEDKSEGVAQEFLEGMASGVIGIGEGIVELGALGVDLIADTSYAQDVREGAQAVRETLGIDPEGMVGKGVEAVVQLGIPGLAAAGAVSSQYKKIIDRTTKVCSWSATTNSRWFG